MRGLHRIPLALTTSLAFVLPAFAAEVNNGEMAAAIRSADYPCDHVLDMQTVEDNDWRVQCNSGTYQVTRDENGQFSIIKANWTGD
ncbi:MAG: hypothetical protein PVH54_07590 [Gammaproteobacteria bacterium]|jgi:hypothetical protein